MDFTIDVKFIIDIELEVKLTNGSDGKIPK